MCVLFYVVQKMNSPYEAPNVSTDLPQISDQLRRHRSFWFRAIWLSLAGVIVPPIIGGAGIVFGMKKAFGELSDSGIGDPAALSNHISSVLIYTVSASIVSLIAFIVLIVAMIRFFSLPKA
jgi:hypothetical protein